MPRPMPPTRPPSRSPSSPAQVGSVLVLTSDAVLARHVLSVVAAVGLVPEQPSTDDDLRRSWRSAGAALVGRDRAEHVVELALPPRREVYVVGRDDDRSETYAWSTRLRAAVATLPGGAPDLASGLSALLAEAGRGAVVALMGGSGGVGTSTLAAALALCGARDGLRALLLDADLGGGGIDILLGAEHLSGWRWGRFDAARGHLGDLAGQLPHCDGVDVLAADRAVGASTALRPEQLAAVLGSAFPQPRPDRRRPAPGPRPGTGAGPAPLRPVLLAGPGRHPRGCRGRPRRALALPRCRRLELIVRTGRGTCSTPGVVADALDLPLAGASGGGPRAPARGRARRPAGPVARSLARVGSAGGCSGAGGGRRMSAVEELEPIRTPARSAGPRPHARRRGRRDARRGSGDQRRGAHRRPGPAAPAQRRAGPLEALLAEPGVTDVLVNGPDQVFVDRGRGLERTSVRFCSEAEVRRLAQRLAASVGRRLDDAVPLRRRPVADGSRVHAVLGTLADPGTCISLRVPASRTFSLADCVTSGSLTPGAAELLDAVVEAKLAFLVSGGTGDRAGRRPCSRRSWRWSRPTERIVIVEDSARAGAIAPPRRPDGEQARRTPSSRAPSR